jgi:hypothetical protein
MKPPPKRTAKKLSLLKSASTKVAQAAERLAKAAARVAPKALTGGRKALEKPTKSKAGAAAAPAVDRPKPRATKLPAMQEPLNKREMEQVLTAGAGRGVVGEGSLKGKLVVTDGLPHLQVVGRDKRELNFLLQGPDQEVLPAYVDHKVSVSGLIKKTTNYAGTVDVRKYSAKKPEEIAPAAPQEPKLKFLSPGEIEQICSPGMGAGMHGFATLKGNLEYTGDDAFLVVSGGGTRQQVSFVLEGKGTKGFRKHVGSGVTVHGVARKESGWGGRCQVEAFEVRAAEPKTLSRDHLEVIEVESLSGDRKSVEVRANNGLTVRLPERAGHIWAIEPTMAKRVGLREANYEPGSPSTREFFFTPRTPGVFDVEFFLAKAFSPSQVARSCVLGIDVKA